MLSLIVPFTLALAAVPAGLRLFSAIGWTRANWRGNELPFPAGVLAVIVACVALLGLWSVGATSHFLASPITSGWRLQGLSGLLLLGFGVSILGFLDDVVNAGPRGLRGHGQALLRGQVSTGALKAGGTIVLTLLVVGISSLRGLLTIGVIVLATNLFNLLDLRPGRACKGFLLVGISVVLASGSLAILKQTGFFIIPLLVVGFYDLRERAMLGDTGANLLGALAGVWLVANLNTGGLAIAVAVLFSLTAWGEFRSFTSTIESNRALSWLDQLGRRGAPERTTDITPARIH